MYNGCHTTEEAGAGPKLKAGNKPQGKPEAPAKPQQIEIKGTKLSK